MNDASLPAISDLIQRMQQEGGHEVWYCPDQSRRIH